MGGHGSTRWAYHRKKQTVGSSFSFDLASLPFAEYFEANEIHARQYNWTSRGEPSGNMGVYFFPHSYIEFRYTTTFPDGRKQDTKQRIEISSMSLNFGGKRYWLYCPHCHKKARILHLPQGDYRFLCRQCHNLTYDSTQEAHKYDRGALAGIVSSYALYDEIRELERKLRMCRGDSKNRRRYTAKLERLERISALSEIASERFFNNTMSRLDKLLNLNNDSDE